MLFGTQLTQHDHHILADIEVGHAVDNPALLQQ